MAKTVAELSSYLDILGNRFEAAVTEIEQLWGENEKLSHQVQEARVEAVKQREEVTNLRRQLDESRAAVRDQERADADLRQELALVRQRLDEHLKRVELWDSRRWGLVVAVLLALFGAGLSFAAGLYLAQYRK